MGGPATRRADAQAARAITRHTTTAAVAKEQCCVRHVPIPPIRRVSIDTASNNASRNDARASLADEPLAGIRTVVRSSDFLVK